MYKNGLGAVLADAAGSSKRTNNAHLRLVLSCAKAVRWVILGSKGTFEASVGRRVVIRDHGKIRVSFHQRIIAKVATAETQTRNWVAVGKHHRCCGDLLG